MVLLPTTTTYQRSLAHRAALRLASALLPFDGWPDRGDGSRTKDRSLFGRVLWDSRHSSTRNAANRVPRLACKPHVRGLSLLCTLSSPLTQVSPAPTLTNPQPHADVPYTFHQHPTRCQYRFAAGGIKSPGIIYPPHTISVAGGPFASRWSLDGRPGRDHHRATWFGYFL